MHGFVFFVRFHVMCVGLQEERRETRGGRRERFRKLVFGEVLTRFVRSNLSLPISSYQFQTREGRGMGEGTYET